MKAACEKLRKEECVSMEVQAAPAGLTAKRAAWENGTLRIKRTAQAAPKKLLLSYTIALPTASDRTDGLRTEKREFRVRQVLKECAGMRREARCPQRNRRRKMYREKNLPEPGFSAEDTPDLAINF